MSFLRRQAGRQPGRLLKQTAHSLGGHGILVTRPSHQAAVLIDLIRAAGGEPVPFPTIEIAAASDPSSLARAVAARGEIDLLIFTSANAVARAVPPLLAAGGLPRSARFAAMGEGTATALAAHGVAEVLIPAAGADTEALLERSELHEMAGIRTFIFTGEGGRRLLAEALAARGADVTIVTCYERRRPVADPAPVERRLAAGTLAAVTAASGEGLRNLFEMVGSPARAALCRLPVFVGHARIADAARALGIDHAEVCGSGDHATVAALAAWFCPVAVASVKQA